MGGEPLPTPTRARPLARPLSHRPGPLAAHGMRTPGWGQWAASTCVAGALPCGAASCLRAGAEWRGLRRACGRRAAEGTGMWRKLRPQYGCLPLIRVVGRQMPRGRVGSRDRGPQGEETAGKARQRRRAGRSHRASSCIPLVRKRIRWLVAVPTPTRGPARPLARPRAIPPARGLPARRYGHRRAGRMGAVVGPPATVHVEEVPRAVLSSVSQCD